MPGLSVTEKNHWRGRIAARIDRRIEAITAGDPGFMERLHREARNKAIESLGLAELQAELGTIAEQNLELSKQERSIRRAIVARIRGVDVECIEQDRYFGPRDPEVDNAIVRRVAIHEEEVLATDRIGREILKLRIERERLLDVVWLATSSSQVRTLWSKVSELLGEGSTRLEREALATEPARDEG
jgi:hypothetical protein